MNNDDEYYETLGIEPPESIKAFRGEYRWLSNFWPAQVKMDGELYQTTENAYQAAKTLDLEKRATIRESKPGKAKGMGKKVVMREDWDQVKLQVMEDLTRQKYAPGSELARKLLATGDAEIIEGNTWNDTFWGVCKGEGENNLGKLIMKVREELRA